MHSPIASKRSLGSSSGTYGAGSNSFNDYREQGFLAKLSTLSRSRRRKQEAEELDAEARQAMEEPLHPTPIDLGIDGCQMAEGEERSMVEPQSRDDPQVRNLMNILMEWINTELVNERILVRDLEADLYDGQVLQKLIEKLVSVKIDHPEVAQTELGQKQRLKVVLDVINDKLGISPMKACQFWPLSAIYNQDLLAILRLLVAIVKRFAIMIRLPRKVQLTVLIVRKINGILQHRRQVEPVTDIEDEPDMKNDHDVISALVDCAVPEKLAAFEQTLLMFVNYHMRKFNIQISNLQSEMSDGVYFILLIGLLGNFFVPLHAYHLSPSTDAQRTTNLQLAFQLVQDSEGIESERYGNVSHYDLKLILRLLYDLYTRHSDLN